VGTQDVVCMAVPRTTALCTSLRSEQVVIVLQCCHANNILRRFNGRNTTVVLHVNLRAGKRLLIRMHLSRFRNPCHQLIVIQRTGLVAQLQLVHTTIKPNDFPEVGKRLFKPIRRRKMIFLGCYAGWWLWCKTPSQNLLWVALQRTRGPLLRPQIHWAVVTIKESLGCSPTTQVQCRL
jgi:hypothetical protein